MFLPMYSMQKFFYIMVIHAQETRWERQDTKIFTTILYN
jgi:hypothetical protein